MSIIHVELARDFRGEDVVLLAMDGAGVATLFAVLKEAVEREESRLQHGGVTHQFIIESGKADIDLNDNRVVWRLSTAKVIEIIECLDVLRSAGRAGHHYVDISKPVDTLVLSRDEYLGVLGLT